MKRLTISTAWVLAGLLFATGAWAAGVKVGFVDTNKLMEKAPQAKQAIKKLEKEFSPREKELVALQREIKKLEDRLEREGVTMSESAHSKLERKILKKKRELKRSRDEFREDLNIRRNEELSKLQRELFKAVVTHAKAEHYDLVLSEGVVYASPRVDITDAVLKQLQKKSAGGSR